MALDVALGMIEAEGLEQVFERHALLGRATREAAKALDLELLGGVADENANVVTAIALPDSIDGGKVPKVMRDRFGITIAGGQGKLKGKIARIAHCGYFGAFDIIVTISALEMTLRELGHEFELGRRRGGGAARLLRRGRPAASRVKVLVKGEDRRLRRRSCCATPASTSSSGSTGTRTSSSAGSASSTAS